MTTGDYARRTSSWEAMHRNLAADAVVAEAVLYAQRRPPAHRRARPAPHRPGRGAVVRAAAELRDDCGLLKVGRVVTGRNLDMRRNRNTYWLDLDALAAEREVVQDDGSDVASRGIQEEA